MITKLLIIGAGPGGYTAAFLAADLGLDVTLIDKELNPGGTCLYRGCIPSKALLHCAKILENSKKATTLGITFSEAQIDQNKIRAWKNSVVEKLSNGLGQLTRARKIKYIQGAAAFLDSNTVEVKKPDGVTEKITFENAIIATGSTPITLKNLPQSEKIIDSATALDFKNIPESLLIIGGGYIGLEAGTIYSSFGTKVSVVEMMPSLLPGIDRDLVNILQKKLKNSFKEILLNTKVTKMEESENGITVAVEDKIGKTSYLEYEKILVSVGRIPNSKNLGLKNTKIKVDDKGFIKVTAQRQTSDPNIYAIGDVAGQPMLAHKAAHEGRIAAENIFGKNIKFFSSAIPSAVFTNPEIAHCGLSETDAKAKGINVKVVKFQWIASGRAMTQNNTDGLTKLIIDPETEKILGAGIAGECAGELISECALAIEKGMSATEIKSVIHPHPTLSETIMESAEIFFGQATHIVNIR